MRLEAVWWFKQGSRFWKSYCVDGEKSLGPAVKHRGDLVMPSLKNKQVRRISTLERQQTQWHCSLNSGALELARKHVG